MSSVFICIEPGQHTDVLNCCHKQANRYISLSFFKEKHNGIYIFRPFIGVTQSSHPSIPHGEVDTYIVRGRYSLCGKRYWHRVLRTQVMCALGFNLEGVIGKYQFYPNRYPYDSYHPLQFSCNANPANGKCKCPLIRVTLIRVPLIQISFCTKDYNENVKHLLCNAWFLLLSPIHVEYSQGD